MTLSSLFEVIAMPRCRIGEGPLWSSREQALYWVDIEGMRLFRHDAAGGSNQSWAMPAQTGFVIERSTGGMLVGLADGVHAFDALTGETRLFAGVPDTPAGYRLNDGCTDSAGRLWFGSMEIEPEQPRAWLCRMDLAGRIERVDGGYVIPNGGAFDDERRCFYHADSMRRVVYVYDVDRDGCLADRRIYHTFPDDWGLPDGMALDRAGHLWVAHWDGGGISRFDPDGVRDRFIALPVSRVTSCAFGGERLDRLFVTSACKERENELLAGAVFEVDAQGAVGVRQAEFGG